MSPFLFWVFALLPVTPLIHSAHRTYLIEADRLRNKLKWLFTPEQLLPLKFKIAYLYCFIYQGWLAVLLLARYLYER